MSLCRPTVSLNLVLSLWVCTSGAIHGQTNGGDGSWHLFGSLETTVTNYKVDGDLSASPYPFDGTFWNSRLELNLEFESDLGRSFLLEVELLGAEQAHEECDGGQARDSGHRASDGVRAE